jgi:hypothetical protein
MDLEAQQRAFEQAVVESGARDLGCPREQVRSSVLHLARGWKYFADGCGQRAVYEFDSTQVPTHLELTGRFKTAGDRPPAQ